MRISNNMMVYGFLNSLNSSMNKQNKLQEQLSDGLAIHRPSDDPVKAIRALRFNNNLVMNEQFTQNAKDAQSWMQTTDGALMNLDSIVSRIKELAVQAGGPNPDTALDAIGKEIDGLINSAIDVGNVKIGDSYVFAGQQSQTKPFTRISLAGNPPVDTVVYNGDMNQVMTRIQPGAQDAFQDSISLTGNDLFGPMESQQIDGKTVMTPKFFNQLIAIKDELTQNKAVVHQSNNQGSIPTISGTFSTVSPDTSEYRDFVVKIDQTNPVTGTVTQISYSNDGGKTFQAPQAPDASPPAPADTFTLSNGAAITISPDLQNGVGNTYSFRFPLTNSTNVDWISNTALAQIDAMHDQIIQAQTELGTRSNAYQMSQTILENNNLIITNDLSANEDLDMPKALIDFKTSQNIYNSALAVGAKIMPTSLVDYLK